MHKLMLAGSAALALMAVPAALQAQSTVGQSNPTTTETAPSTNTPRASPGPDAPRNNNPVSRALSGDPTPTRDQQAAMNGWSDQQKTDYRGWPNDYKVYYWTLNSDQQRGYWALSADQRGQIYKMTPEQRQVAWNAVVQQMSGKTPTTPPGQANPPGEGVPTNGVPDPQAAAQSAPPAMPADPGYQGGPYKGALTPPPATAMDKTYPRCSKTVHDSCRNGNGV